MVLISDVVMALASITIASFPSSKKAEAAFQGSIGRDQLVTIGEQKVGMTASLFKRVKIDGSAEEFGVARGR